MANNQPVEFTDAGVKDKTLWADDLPTANSIYS